MATTRPSVGGAIGRGCGESFASERCVRDWWYTPVPTQDANQSGFIHDDHVIEALASDGADEPLRIRVLPRGTRGGAEFLDVHATRRRGERGKRVVAIVNEIARSRVFGKRLAELLRGPCGGRMRGDGDVSDAPTPVGHNDEHEQ